MKKITTDNPLPSATTDVVQQQKKRESHTATGWSESSSDWNAPPIESEHAPAPTPAALIANNLCVQYGSTPTLKDVSFTLYQGDTLGLLGLNGAGKSTLLQVLSGALAPNSGTVHVGDHELYESQIETRMQIGYAPDKPPVYPEFKVSEFLGFIARVRRIPRSRCKQSINDAIERCALGEVKNRIIGNLSSGYQQRVNLAQALIHQPRILVLDEPANGLDPVQLMEMRELITTLTSEQATIFSSHLLPEVNAICNRVMLIHTGQQILDSPLKQLSHKDNNSFELHIENEAQLHDLPGIANACRLAEKHWIVTGRLMTEAHLKTMLESRAIKLISLRSVNNYLEGLFQRLAPGDQAASNGDNE